MRTSNAIGGRSPADSLKWWAWKACRRAGVRNARNARNAALRLVSACSHPPTLLHFVTQTPGSRPGAGAERARSYQPPCSSPAPPPRASPTGRPRTPSTCSRSVLTTSAIVSALATKALPHIRTDAPASSATHRVLKSSSRPDHIGRPLGAITLWRSVALQWIREFHQVDVGFPPFDRETSIGKRRVRK